MLLILDPFYLLLLQPFKEFLEWLGFGFHLFDLVDNEGEDLVLRFLLGNLICELLGES